MSSAAISASVINAATSERIYPSSDLEEVWSSTKGTSIAVLIICKDDTVIFCRDDDPRPVVDKEGNVVSQFRPAHGTYKASFGYRGTPTTFLDKDQPANRAMLGTLSDKKLETGEFFYREGGDGWQVITLPQYYEGDSDEWIAELNLAYWKAVIEGKKPWTSNFVKLPRKKCIGSTPGSPAVYDETKYVKITEGRTTYTLWDEEQMRNQLLPLLTRFE